MDFLAYVKKLLYLCTLINFRNIDLDPLRRGLFIVLYSLCMLFICAQEVLVLPYEATGLTEEQKAMNPERLAYPTELKETIKSEVSFECTPQEMELGPFSVSATKQVVFSPGNLQFNAAKGSHSCADGSTQPGTWRFAEHQWDYVGDATNGTVYENGVKCNNSNPSATYDGWIDMFGWGTSGWNSGATEYQPWSAVNMMPYYCPGGSGETNLTGDYAYADWAVYNQIGTDPPATWRTLTYEEMEYVLYTRPNHENLAGKARVNGVYGIVLLPDYWNLPADLTFTPGVQKGNANYYNNTYTAEQWAKMEKAGAVFFPATGHRIGGNVSYNSSGGRYWLASYYSSSYVRAFTFSPWGEESDTLLSRYNRSLGYAVRPVKDIP